MANPENIKGQGFHTDPERINRKGRPTKLPGLDVLLLQCIDESQWEGVISALTKKALKGDVRAIECLLDRGFGKAKQTFEIELPAVRIENMTPDQEQLLAEVRRQLQEIDNEDLTDGSTR